LDNVSRFFNLDFRIAEGQERRVSKENDLQVFKQRIQESTKKIMASFFPGFLIDSLPALR
jgi:hypothetical protein